ncbi:TSUP family transporter [uncultured Veillonella sp.]|uniref:TSUP family transporter n=1 Tax=uncultured Veillonella sp. TaxID=159268 RepID=UPI0025F2147F|nr:TSUP family transporter [uncultured Veillonella sp.]MDY3974707.1 TSUP family transporter [Veillonella caviae]
MIEGDIAIAGILLLAGALAGFVDSIVGGGGLISVPAFFLTNLPPSFALGSNKLASVFGALTASIAYARSGMVEWSLVKKLLPATFIGSILGTFLVVSIPPLYLKPIIIVLLVSVLIFVIFKKDWGAVSTYVGASRKKIVFLALGALTLGFYDGFVGPGTGTFLIFMFIYGGFNFLFASGNAKILNFMSNVASLIIFISMGHVNYLYGLSAAVGQIIGANFGARLAIRKGAGLVRFVFITTTVCMLSKMIYDYLITHW